MGKKENMTLRDWAREGLCRVMELHRKSGSERGVLPEGFSVMWDGGVDAHVDATGKNTEKKSQMKVKASLVFDEISGAAWYRMMLYADGEEVFVSRPASE